MRLRYHAIVGGRYVMAGEETDESEVPDAIRK